jgi:hypothetical protein
MKASELRRNTGQLRVVSHSSYRASSQEASLSQRGLIPPPPNFFPVIPSPHPPPSCKITIKVFTHTLPI